MSAVLPALVFPRVLPRDTGLMSAGTFRVVVVGAVVVLSVLGLVAFMVALSGELSDRSVLLFTAVLGFLGPTVTALLLLLRTDQKISQLHDDVLNGPLRENVKKAISEDRHDKANRDAVEQGRRQIAERQARRAGQEGERP